MPSARVRERRLYNCLRFESIPGLTSVDSNNHLHDPSLPIGLTRILNHQSTCLFPNLFIFGPTYSYLSFDIEKLTSWAERKAISLIPSNHGWWTETAFTLNGLGNPDNILWG